MTELDLPDSRVAVIAAALFPDEVSDASDCLEEIGREGLPCRHCAARNEQWAFRLRQTRAAILAAFA